MFNPVRQHLFCVMPTPFQFQIFSLSKYSTSFRTGLFRKILSVAGRKNNKTKKSKKPEEKFLFPSQDFTSLNI